jgi:hypothetical protein
MLIRLLLPLQPTVDLRRIPVDGLYGAGTIATSPETREGAPIQLLKSCLHSAQSGGRQD